MRLYVSVLLVAAVSLMPFTPPAQGQATDAEELAPLPLDMTGVPPVVVALYRATRERNDKEALARINEARRLVENGADVKATDGKGRTALHWTAFGTSHRRKTDLSTPYEALAELLIAGGVDVNQEDIYRNTALDYVEYAADSELHTLLLEHGGVSGYFTGGPDRFAELFEKVTSATGSTSSERLEADLRPGQTIPIRLLTPVWSDRSRGGDPVEAVVTAPVSTDGRVVLPPSTRVQGTVVLAQRAPNKYMRPRLVLDFASIVHRSGARSPLYSRLAAIDNARETVRNNEIIGIVQPHASTKVSWGMRLAGMVPAVSLALEGMRTAYGLSLRREIFLPEGTDMLLQVSGPSRMQVIDPWPGWANLTVDEELKQLVQQAPLRTAAKDGTPSDLTNMLLLGDLSQIEEAFRRAGWLNADRLNIASVMKTFEATVRRSGYEQAPVSLLTLNGAEPDLVLQKGLNTFAKRHHLRLWRQPGTYRGQEVWFGAGTHDIGIGVGGVSKWFHRIDSRVDRERARVEQDLLFAGAGGFALVDRPQAPRSAKNATGDDIVTDGRMLVLQVGSTGKSTPAVNQ